MLEFLNINRNSKLRSDTKMEWGFYAANNPILVHRETASGLFDRETASSLFDRETVSGLFDLPSTV